MDIKHEIDIAATPEKAYATLTKPEGLSGNDGNFELDAQTFAPDDSTSAIISKFRSDLGKRTGPFGLLVRFQVRSGAEAQVQDHFDEVRPRTLRDPGCIAFEMSRHATDPCRFVVYEKWSDLGALDVHLRTPHASKLRHAFNQLIDGLPEFSVLLPID
jgi:quinol monooxygenase YgiN